MNICALERSSVTLFKIKAKWFNKIWDILWISTVCNFNYKCLWIQLPIQKTTSLLTFGTWRTFILDSVSVLKVLVGYHNGLWMGHRDMCNHLFIYYSWFPSIHFLLFFSFPTHKTVNNTFNTICSLFATVNGDVRSDYATFPIFSNHTIECLFERMPIPCSHRQLKGLNVIGW